jgi:glycosyltransferase EpsD
MKRSFCVSENKNFMAKILYLATSDIHLNTFHRPYIDWFVQEGHQIDLAFERRGDYTFPGIHQEYLLDFPRKFDVKKIVKSYKKLHEIIEKNHYDLIHCHTPIPSFIARLTSRNVRENGGKVIYTAHGFHFYKGGPLKNWLVYYPAEYILSLFTDAIIVMNKEDFGYINGKMLHKESILIPGIGVDSVRFQNKSDAEIQRIRASMGYVDKDILLLYIAEFIPRKNHEFLIRCMRELIKVNPNIKLVLAGRGILLEKMKKLARELEISERIDFLGFRNDIHELAAIADIGITVSMHEGLGLGVIEQMMCGIPVIASIDRGHNETVNNGVNGYLYRQNDRNDFLAKVTELTNKPHLRKKMGHNGMVDAQKFELKNSLAAMINIYKKYLP